MAQKMRSSIRSLSLAALLAVAQALSLAPPVLQERASYNGGWALAIPGSSCPADAPVACPTAGGNVNPACCPNGQTCFGLKNQHCCPTNSECENVVTNFPACANSTWNMYALSFSSRTFFCCEPGQYGVLPISGYTGICEPVDQPVASSLVATSASQAGGTGVATAVQAPSTGTVTSTMRDGALTTILTTALLATASSTATGTGNGSPASTAGATGSGFGQSGTVTFHISKGGLIGIVLVAIIVLATIIIFCVYWRKRKADRRRGGAALAGNGGGTVYAGTGTPMHAAFPQTDDMSPSVVYAQPVGGSPGVQQGYPPQDYGKCELPSPVMHTNTHAAMSPNMEVPASRRWERPYGMVELP
ncbi:hypothetical protein F5882DRAFT_32141 [Hyaloscypha sp. PMI_1271]|nr:hypothetical protein F5882DRAFT_32141 [Hyaloscypha sp. PMI_1271]